MNQHIHRVVVLMGSNISPVDNLRQAYLQLRNQCTVKAVSNVWENAAFGSPGPNFMNAAILIETTLSNNELKSRILHPIEDMLGRVRTADKNAPRTIDLDIIISDDQVCDPNLWSRLHSALPVSELLADWVNPQNGEALADIARSLKAAYWALEHPEVLGRSITDQEKRAP